MRLTRLHLAGFKSFVDPTEVRFPSSLVGVVGPNGCGKSNLIDAVRWVMGESSARQLRGQALEDVIFSGASSRKPASMAAVELVFDNSEGRLGGEYARYAEIAVRRELSRDGQSRFYLNNTRCRRRDIADLFLGTGLGGRSYSIIEQGQVNRIVEARPEALRAYLEEAAGISRYRERRRETAQRIAHTRENLERLADLREELGRQLARLDRQAKAAARYRRLRGRAREVEGRLLALTLRQAEAREREREAALADIEQAVAASEAERRRAADAVEAIRRTLEQAQQAVNLRQAAVYEVGARQTQAQMRIAQLQTDRDHQARQQQRDLQRQQQLSREVHSQQANLASQREDLATARALESQLREQQRQASVELEQADAQMRAAQADWDGFIETAGEPTQRLAGIEEQLGRLRHGQRRLEQELAGLDLAQTRQRRDDAEAARVRAEVAYREQGEAVALAERAISQAEADLARARAAAAEAEERHATCRADYEDLRARAQALAQVVATERPDGDIPAQAQGRLVDWLADQGVADDWLERRLGPALQGWLLDDLSALLHSPDALSSGQWWLEPFADEANAERWLRDFLDSRHRVESLPEALAGRRELAPGHALVTPEGTLVGRHWLLTAGEGQQAGVLARRAALRQIEAALPARETAMHAARTARGEALATLRRCEAALSAAQSQLKQRLREQGQAEVDLTRSQATVAQVEQTLAQLQHRQTELAERIARQASSLEELEGERRHWQARQDAMRQARAERERARNAARDALDAARHEHDRLRKALHEQSLKCGSLGSRIEMTESELRRARHEAQALQVRQQQQGERLADLDAELATARAALAADDEEVAEARAALESVRQSLEAVQQRERESITALHAAEKQLESHRSEAEAARLSHQEARLRRDVAAQAYRECEAVAEGFAPPLMETESAESLKDRLDQLREQIRKLGNVNLTAIDEFEQAGHRKADLDAQDADLKEALAQLEAAIARMDRETRARFRETFDQVNSRLGPMFARLFGGGEAMLTLDENDLLEGGVHLMSRPPGKRVSHLSLLSGGEKALTAVALIFAIFSLNPAPFCILDELDAPLDEANVGRFCDMVRDMAEQVQFVIITHNKTTMENASQLIGVTMREPGVSRIVSVDLDEAVQLIESET